ncbi:hypothetical protein TNCV_3266081 [Trichonephila clavipes]|nr:hypothetical protein TNCV_3266081 [Trichonephila clavipes]
MSVNVLFKHEASLTIRPSPYRHCCPCRRLSTKASYHVRIASAPATSSASNDWLTHKTLSAFVSIRSRIIGVAWK